ncbi:mCG62747 [Mus musculus]|nr:mCG62747 [Mus musculus]
MLSLAPLLSLLLLCVSGKAETTVTQSPTSLSMATGEKVTIRCITRTDIDDDMNWYQQKPGEPPKLLISEGNTLRPGVPSRFSNSGYGTDFLLTIENTLSEDVADYYCLQSDNLPLTVLCPLTETCRCCQCHCISCN